MKSPFKLWQHLHESWTCYKSVISLILNKQGPSKRNLVNPVLCAVLTQLVFFVNATLRYQSPRRPRVSQLAREKRRDESFQAGPCLKTISETCSKILLLILFRYW